jgi:hypothetical protein
MSEQQAAMTRGFAKGLGLFFIVFGIVVAMRSTSLYLLIPAFFQDGALVFVTGVFGIGVGAAMIAGHHHWNSLPAIVISLFGWVTLIRSAAILVAPALISSIATSISHIAIFPMIAGLVAALVGVWLSFVGWFSKKA